MAHAHGTDLTVTIRYSSFRLASIRKLCRMWIVVGPPGERVLKYLCLTGSGVAVLRDGGVASAGRDREPDLR